MLKFKQTAATKSHPHPSTLPSSSSNITPSAFKFSDIKCEPCKASIVIHNITIPLAWPASEYFDHKGEWREFNVCLSLKAAGGKLMRSKIHQRVNRTITDLRFDETFIFSDLGPDFTIEALISAKKMDIPRLQSSSPFASVANTVSRSFGRKFGANYKKYSQAQNSYTISAYNFPSRDEIFASPVENLLPIGRCFFRLENAGLSGKIRVYSLALVSAERINPSLSSMDLLPLFGTISCQVLCRPDCLQTTFIRSILDIFYVDEQLLLEKLECALEGGKIKCYTKDKKDQVALCIPIDQRTQLRPTAYQSAFKIILHDEGTHYTKEFMFILSNESQVMDWGYAMTQQISNASAWKEFASISSNPFALKQGNEFTKPFDDSQSMKGRTMTNTDEIRGGLRQISKRGDRRRVQSVFQDDLPKDSPPPKPMEEERKIRSTSIPKQNVELPAKTPKQMAEIQKPKIVDQPPKPIPKPRIINPPSTLLTPTPPKQIVLVNRGYVTSPTKTSPRILKKLPATVSAAPQGNSVKYVDSVKSNAEFEEAKPKQKVKLEFQEDTIEKTLHPPRPHRVLNNNLPASDAAKTSIPVIRDSNAQQKPSIKAIPPNTYVIRLNVGMDDEDIPSLQNAKKPPKYPPSYHHQQQISSSASSKPFISSSSSSQKPKSSFNHDPPNSFPPPLPPAATMPSNRPKIISPSTKLPPKMFLKFDSEVTRL